MSLLDDLRNLLARHLAHVQSGTNQGVTRLIEDHLARLEAVVSADEVAAEAKVHEVLGELYAATNAPAGSAPSAPAVPAPASEPVIVGEPGPEIPAPANPTSMAPAAADQAPVPDAAPAPAEAAEPSTALTDTNPAA